MLASVILMTVDHRQQHLESVRAGLATLLYPLQALIDLPAISGAWLFESLTTRRELLEQNEQLRREYLLLNARMHKFEALQSENTRLKQLLGSSEKLSERTLIAELIAVDLDPNQQQILLDKGSRHGVEIGQPVMDAHGVMGQVIHVSPFTATAILITDPNHALPVRINRNGLRTIAVGTGALNRLELPHLPNNADIQEGDLLITSGLGGRFPADYPVGVVSKVEQDTGRPFATVQVTPSAHLDRSREVLLVWPAVEPPDFVGPMPEFVGPPAPPLLPWSARP